jgi:hypothetical protein
MVPHFVHFFGGGPDRDQPGGLEGGVLPSIVMPIRSASRKPAPIGLPS